MREETDETRQIILRVGYHLFMTYGYRAVTTRQLAEACGLTQPALYHHFADKQELYLAIVTEELDRIKAAVERITRRSEGVTERLRQAASYFLSRSRYDLSLMLHDVRYELSPEARDELSARFRNGFIVPIASLFEEGIQKGELLKVHEGGLPPIASAYLFLSIVSRFGSQQREESATQVRETDYAASANLCVRLLLHGLASSH